MKLSPNDFQWAVDQGIITSEQHEQLWKGLLERQSVSSKFDMPHVLYYLGAMIVIAAMGWFMTEAWEKFGGGGILIISVIYALCFVLAGRTLWFQNFYYFPGYQISKEPRKDRELNSVFGSGQIKASVTSTSQTTNLR